MLQSAAEIKSEILRQSYTPDGAKSRVSKKDREASIELGRHVRNMMGTTGWKIVESWLLRNLDVAKILSVKPDQLPIAHAKAQAYATVLQQVNYWVNMAKQLEEEDKEETK